MKKVLILGGSGLVGAFLRSNLISSYAVDATSRKGENGLMRFDTWKEETYSIFNQPYDFVLDCLVTYHFDSTENIKADAVAKENILRQLSRFQPHYIAISSISATPENKDRSDYNLSKFLTEEAIQRCAELFKVKAAILRFGQIFDDDSLARKTQKALYYFIDCFRNNAPLKVFGNPQMKRSYMPIEILAATVRKTMAEQITGVHNVLMPDSYSSSDFIGEWSSITNFSSENLEFHPEQQVSEYVIPESSELFKAFLQDKTCKPYFKRLLLKNHET